MNKTTEKQKSQPQSPKKKKLLYDLEKLRQAQLLRLHSEEVDPSVPYSEVSPSVPLRDQGRLSRSPSPALEIPPFPQLSPKTLFSLISLDNNPSSLTSSITSATTEEQLPSPTAAIGKDVWSQRQSPFPLPSPDAPKHADIGAQWASEIKNMPGFQPDTSVLPLQRSASTPRLISAPILIGDPPRVSPVRPRVYATTPPARSISMLSKIKVPLTRITKSLEDPVTYSDRASLQARTCIIRARRSQLSPVEDDRFIIHDQLSKSVSPTTSERAKLTDEHGSRTITPEQKNASFADGHRYATILMIGCGTFNDTVALASLLDLYKIKCEIHATEIRTKADLNKSGQFDELQSNIKKLKEINDKNIVKIRVRLGIDGTQLHFHASQQDIGCKYDIVYSFFPYSPESMTALVKQLFHSVNAILNFGAEFRIALTPLIKYNASLETANIGTQLKNFGQSLKWSENHDFFLDDYEHRRTIPGDKTYPGCRAVDIASRLFYYVKVPEVQRGLDKEAHSPESRKKIERDKRIKNAKLASQKPESQRKLFS